ncbi:MAG: hypothetical protein JO305_09290 [Alphaproteobacteria bacterium]|nr:hypothetical protein [Alphaproteobacteria bacterium]
MYSVRLPARRQAGVFAIVLGMLLGLAPAGAFAFDLFATHQVNVQFATPDGKPMANAEVRVFAPGEADRPYLTGRADADGKFEFGTDRDGFWTAEAQDGTSVGRVMIRVGKAGAERNGLSPVLVIGGLVVLLIVAFWYRVLRAKARRPRA